MEEEYPDDEGGSGGNENRRGEAQLGEEDRAEDNKLSVVRGQESDAATSGAERSMSDQEGTETTTTPDEKDSLSSTAFCLVSKKKRAVKAPS